VRHAKRTTPGNKITFPYKIIFGFLLIGGLLFWRYNDIKKKRLTKNNVEYESDSEVISTEE
jgi:hypothetical protein